MSIYYKIRLKAFPLYLRLNLLLNPVPYLFNKVHAPPEDNKANIELIKFLRRHFGADVSMMRGLTSRKKVVRIY
ncbi:MAG: DUF167 domain-containing protein [DPANN group archaeon]|nr:DUF167 domain-containing protein [DPANN group archaeon]